MKKTVKILFMLFLLIGITKGVQANSINSIEMDIYVDKNGNAKITEVWDCTTTEGTEVYHPYYNLGNSQITNLLVTENEKAYINIGSWNTSGSLSNKANKCGINKIVDGVEICWGISKYAKHQYTINYTITNFVSELKDSQMIYWTLIPYEFSSTIGRAYIKIYSDYYMPGTTDVWGYGNYGGTCYVDNGYIEMESDGSLSSNEYMTVLVKLPLGTFNTDNILNNTFDYYFNIAEEGTTKYKSNDVVNKISYFYSFFTITVIPIILPILVFFRIIRGKVKSKLQLTNNKVLKNVPYFRDIPCNKDLFRAYYIASKCRIISKKYDLLGAIILKWLKEGIVKIEKKEAGTIIKREENCILFTDNVKIENIKENQIYLMLKEASEDGVLENKELEKWCRTKYNELLNWFNDLLDDEEKKLLKEGLIIKKQNFFEISYIAKEQIEKEAIQLKGLKKYLNDYTLIKDREAIEVTLFEEYLIYAQLMGIADKVAKQFKDLYPEVIEQSKFGSYEDILFINNCSRRGTNSASSAKARAESYSSGGGGFSSGGGGGGSFGGGGGRRWISLKSKLEKNSKYKAVDFKKNSEIFTVF